MASGLSRHGHGAGALALYARVLDDCEVVLARVPAEEDALAHAAEDLLAHALDAALQAAADVGAAAQQLARDGKAAAAVKQYAAVLGACAHAQRSHVVLAAESYDLTERLHAQALYGALRALPDVCELAEAAARAHGFSSALKLGALVVDVCERVRGGLPANDPMHAEAEQLHARALEGSLTHAIAAFSEVGGRADAAKPASCAPAGASLPRETLSEILRACKRVLVSHGVGTAALRESAQQLYRPALLDFRQALNAAGA